MLSDDVVMSIVCTSPLLEGAVREGWYIPPHRPERWRSTIYLALAHRLILFQNPRSKLYMGDIVGKYLGSVFLRQLLSETTCPDECGDPLEAMVRALEAGKVRSAAASSSEEKWVAV